MYGSNDAFQGRTQRNWAYEFGRMNDEELFKKNDFGSDAQLEACKAERARRTEAKRREQERLEQERATKYAATKEAVRYSDKLAVEICERIAVGELLIRICRDEHMPTMRRCNQWLKEHPDFASLYRDSINDRLSVFEEEVLEIADDMRKDFKEIEKNGKVRRVVDPEVIIRAKLRIEVRFRHLKAGRPQKWGDAQTISVKTESENLDDMSLDDLEKKITDMEIKDSIVRAA